MRPDPYWNSGRLSNLTNSKNEHKKAKKTTIPPIFGTHPVCEERLFGLSTKFFSMAILNTGTRIFQPSPKPIPSIAPISNYLTINLASLYFTTNIQYPINLCKNTYFYKTTAFLFFKKVINLPLTQQLTEYQYKMQMLIFTNSIFMYDLI